MLFEGVAQALWNSVKNHLFIFTRVSDGDPNVFDIIGCGQRAGKVREACDALRDAIAAYYRDIDIMYHQGCAIVLAQDEEAKIRFVELARSRPPKDSGPLWEEYLRRVKDELPWSPPDARAVTAYKMLFEAVESLVRPCLPPAADCADTGLRRTALIWRYPTPLTASTGLLWTTTHWCQPVPISA